MKILICQPKHESQLETLKQHLQQGIKVDSVLLPEGYLPSPEALAEAQLLAARYRVSLMTSYRSAGRDIAVVIDNHGKIVYERQKTSAQADVVLNQPLTFSQGKHPQIGVILCMEILKAQRDIQLDNYDIFVQPIGVGMFSDEQFDLWLGEAKKLAKKHQGIVMGTSHADGSYKNCGISIPIAYCINSDGKIVFVAKNDLRSRIVTIQEQKFVLQQEVLVNV